MPDIGMMAPKVDSVPRVVMIPVGSTGQPMTTAMDIVMKGTTVKLTPLPGENAMKIAAKT